MKRPDIEDVLLFSCGLTALSVAAMALGVAVYVVRWAVG